jgi:hypothetical protein
MIEVLILQGAEVLSRAEAETPEFAVDAARTLWDDNVTGLQGQQKKMSVCFLVNDQLVKSIERRP